MSLRRQKLWEHIRLDGKASHECHFLTTTGSEKDAHDSVHKHHSANFISSDAGQQRCRENKRKVFLFWTCQAHDTQSRLKQARPWLPRSFWGPGGSQYPMNIIMGNEQKCHKGKAEGWGGVGHRSCTQEQHRRSRLNQVQAFKHQMALKSKAGFSSTESKQSFPWQTKRDLCLFNLGLFFSIFTLGGGG